MFLLWLKTKILREEFPLGIKSNIFQIDLLFRNPNNF